MSSEATTPAAQPPGSPSVPAPPPPDRTPLWKRWGRALGRGCRHLASHPRRLAVAVAVLALLAFGAKLVGTRLWAWSEWRAARSCLERYHNREAAEHLHNCMDVWPDDAEVLLLAARAARRLGEFETAEKLLNRCTAPGRHADEVELENVLLRAARGEIGQVGAFCEALIAREHPATSLVLEALVYGSLETLRIPYAARTLDEWLKRQPDNPQAHFFRGSLHHQLGNYDQAAVSFRRALELDPDLDAVRLALASLLLQLNRPTEALPHLEYLRGRTPRSAKARTQLAACLARLGQEGEAAKVLDEVLTEFPHYPPALAERGKLAFRAGDLDRAEALLKQACARSRDHTAHYQLYLCLGERRKTEEARAVLKQMKEIEADLQRIHELRSVALPRSPRDPTLLHELGRLLLRTDEVGEGLRYLQRALQENPEHGPTHATLADYYQRTGQLGRAVRHRELAAPNPPGQAGPP